MNFAVDTELFSAIVPIFFWLLLKCQDVTTNAHWPFTSPIYVSSFSFLLILLSRNNKCIFFSNLKPHKVVKLEVQIGSFLSKVRSWRLLLEPHVHLWVAADVSAGPHHNLLWTECSFTINANTRVITRQKQLYS